MKSARSVLTGLLAFAAIFGFGYVVGTVDTANYLKRVTPAAPIVSEGYGDLVPSKVPDYDLGSKSIRVSDKEFRAIYHENFEYQDGVLRVLKPILFVNATGLDVQIHRSLSDATKQSKYLKTRKIGGVDGVTGSGVPVWESVYTEGAK